jgi:hypothetical protein
MWLEFAGNCKLAKYNKRELAMLINEMITDAEKNELLQLLNLYIRNKQQQAYVPPTTQQKLQHAQQNKLNGLVKRAEIADVKNMARVTDDDKVMALRAYRTKKQKQAKQ